MTKILMLGGTGVIGESILSVIGNDAAYDVTVTSSVLAYWYLVKYFWLLLPFYGTIKETAVISYGKTKKVQNQTYG